VAAIESSSANYNLQCETRIRGSADVRMRMRMQQAKRQGTTGN